MTNVTYKKKYKNITKLNLQLFTNFSQLCTIFHNFVQLLTTFYNLSVLNYKLCSSCQSLKQSLVTWKHRYALHAWQITSVFWWHTLHLLLESSPISVPVACMARGSSCNLSCSRRSRGGRSSRVISIRKLQNQGFTELSLCFGFLVPCYSYPLMNDERIHHSDINEVVE